MNITPLVAIRCITYNHAPYIEEAMHGFTMQETNFPFVAIIADDASTDGEQDVINNYLNEYFDMTSARQWENDDAYFIEACHQENKNCWFVVVLQKYNFYQIGKSAKFLIAEWLDSAKYIALCEGDDYWIVEDKLQKQVDFLENNDEIGMVYTNAHIFREKDNSFVGVWGKEVVINNLLFEHSPIPTLTVCMRSVIYNNYITISKNEPSWPLGDVPTWIYFIVFSKIHFIPLVSGVYRLLEESASHSVDFYKRTEFISKAFLCRQYYANKYVGKKMAKKVAIVRINNLLYQSFLFDKQLNQPLLKDMVKNRIFNLKLFILVLLSNSAKGRKLVNKHRRS